MTQKQDEKEFEEYFEKEMYIFQFATVRPRADIFKIVKGWMKETWLASRKTLREKEANDRKYAQI